MRTPSAVDKYRPDPSRSVKIFDYISMAAASNLVDEIKYLNEKSNAPITVYIKSGGGELDAFYKLCKQLDIKDKNSRKTEIITVAYQAKSAAAYLLVVGDQAYVYRVTKLCFHGVLCLNEKSLKSPSREICQMLAIQLDRENRKLARMMAAKVYRRLVVRYCLVGKNLPRLGRQPLQRLRYFLDEINAHLSMDSSRKLLYESFDRLKLFSSIKPLLSADLSARRSKARIAAKEAAIYKAILAYELCENPEKDWSFRPGVMVEVIMDYLLARDMLNDGERGIAPFAYDEFVQNLLSQREFSAWRKICHANQEKARKYLQSKLGPHQWHLWCFSLVFSQRLLLGENIIGANDAYWLGLVDAILDQ
jgi:ATP-dependent protease ClpP protease subunit